MKIEKRRNRPEPHIPFISLADIAWQIIIFFLVASTLAMSNSMNLDIPAASGKQQSQQQPKTITVQATDSQILVDGKPVPVEKLQAYVSTLLKDKKSEQDRAVIMEGKDDLSFQRDADIMYAIQKAGGVLVMQEDK